MTNDPATALWTRRRERLDGTFETVKHVLPAIRFDAETLVVIIPANFTLGHRALSFKTSSNIGNWMGNRREGLSSLRETTFQPTFSPDDFTFPNWLPEYVGADNRSHSIDIQGLVPLEF
jgi:hypothetical protein